MIPVFLTSCTVYGRGTRAFRFAGTPFKRLVFAHVNACSLFALDFVRLQLAWHLFFAALRPCWRHQYSSNSCQTKHWEQQCQQWKIWFYFDFHSKYLFANGFDHESICKILHLHKFILQSMFLLLRTNFPYQYKSTKSLGSGVGSNELEWRPINIVNAWSHGNQHKNPNQHSHKNKSLLCKRVAHCSRQIFQQVLSRLCASLLEACAGQLSIRESWLTNLQILVCGDRAGSTIWNAWI